mgnify:CR=1 FL=1
MAALLLPWLEIIFGTALLTGLLRRGAMALLVPLMLLFLAAQAWAWSQGLQIPCGCFGPDIGATSWGWAIARNVGILLALLAVAVSDDRRNRPPYSPAQGT